MAVSEEARKRIAARQRKRKSKGPLESTLEQRFVDAARGREDVQVVKLNLFARRSWPDRMIVGEDETLLFIEFKRRGEKPTDKQEDVHKFLRRCGFDVRVIDEDYGVDGAKLLLDEILTKDLCACLLNPDFAFVRDPTLEVCDVCGV